MAHQARGGALKQPYAYGGAGLSAGSPPVAEERLASPEYSVPFPRQAVMFRVCAKCNRNMEPVAVPHGDPGEGRVSHGYCEPCAAIAWAEAEAFLRGLGLRDLQGGVA